MSAISDPGAPQNYGEVFTRRWVVDALLDLTEYRAERDLGPLTAVEPSAGTGAILLPTLVEAPAAPRVEAPAAPRVE